jgi:hypothetical protein
MSEKLQESVEQELDRIGQLDLTEQPEAFGALRDQLEAALEAPETN